MTTPDEPTRPLLEVVRGDPTPAELAALVTAVSAKLTADEAAGSPGQQRRQRSAWADPARRLRRPLRPGPDAWRRHGLPG